MRINPGDAVTVLRDIFRLPEVPDGPQRVPGLYAKAGDKGKVLEIFRNERKCGSQCLYAKVLIGDQCKTLRLTSLTKE